MEIGRLVASSGHEQVVFAAERSVGLRLIIAVHSTALGPSLGGVRFWHYSRDEDALRDALRLSEAMSYKAAVAGLDQGGGKAVCLVDDPAPARDDAFRHEIGRAVDSLGGRYIAAEDVGATQADMDGIAEVTPWVTGVDPARGGSGDPSPVTAVGVLAGMRAACERAFEDAALAGRTVAVQGAGHVGSRLVELLVAADAEVSVSDVVVERAMRLRDRFGVAVTDPEVVPACDVFAPCALGGVVTVERAAELQCRVVCGAANNQLATPLADDALVERGIVYAPDFVVNAGGIINIAHEFARGGRYDAAAAVRETERIEATTGRVLDEAAARGIAPGRTAVALARERIASEGAGRRFEPGDPASWTNGAPLTRLRA